MGFARAYREGDAYDLVPRLRQADLNEIQAASGRDPLSVLREGAERSVPSCTILGNNGYVAGMFGVVPEGDFGRIWMFGSVELLHPPLRRQFIKECPAFVKVMERPYLAIGNYIDERNTVHIRWLRWLGFIFIHRHAHYGFEQRPFLEFIKCVSQPLL